MFNQFQNDRLQQQKEKNSELEISQAHRKIVHKKKTDRLSEEYQKRMERECIRMAVSPIPIKSHRQSPSLDKYTQATTPRLNYENSIQRIRHAKQDQSLLDLVPLSEKRYCFRQRIKQKEIQPIMRYKSVNRFERLCDIHMDQKSYLDITSNLQIVKDQGQITHIWEKPEKLYYKTLKTLAAIGRPNYIQPPQGAFQQDQRVQQQKSNGFAYRTLDTKNKLPTLKQLKYMQGGRGDIWLTDNQLNKVARLAVRLNNI